MIPVLVKDSYSWTPLSYAAESGHETVLSPLLENLSEIPAHLGHEWPIVTGRSGKMTLIDGNVL